jgi:hypothetical protein
METRMGIVMLRKLVLAIGVVCIFSTPVMATGDFSVDTDKAFVYNVWCRHDALHWGSVVGESSQVRVSIGMYNAGKGNILHAQPEIKILDSWYYFKMKSYVDDDTTMTQARLIIISMPKRAGHTWKKLYSLTWMEFALVQNTWMIQKNGRNQETKGRKAWTIKMNKIIDLLRKK